MWIELALLGLAALNTPAAPADDSLRAAARMPDLVVQAGRTGRTVAAGEVRLGEYVIEVRDGRSIADLGPLLPSTRANVNSRGEALFMVRGASERHVPVFLEGIPLTVPWDERADLSMLPTDAVDEVQVQRGMPSVLAGPNALAGTVHLLPHERPVAGHATRVALQAGEAERFDASVTHARKQGGWDLLASLAHRRREAVLVPEGWTGRHQSERAGRTNSDLEQSALVMRAGRAWDGTRVSMLVLAAGGEKGVSPEGHVDGARFWRYPHHRRLLLGTTGRTTWGASGRWDLQASLAADLFDQEIRPFDDSTYASPALAPGVAYEEDRDRTAYAQLQVSRRLGRATRLTGKTVARATRHRERLEVAGEQLDYSQLLLSGLFEAEHDWAGRWRARAGLGWERAATPETGDKPDRAATADPVLQARIETSWSLFEVYASAARRSRFPSLRELFSGALGKFLPNPDLEAERQTLLETGLLADLGPADVALSAFTADLEGGIEQIQVGTKRQRVNVDEIRTLGLELAGAWRIHDRLHLQAHHTILAARRRVDGEYRGPVEDRPDYLSSLSIGWDPAGGVALLLEGAIAGARHSADATDEADGLRRLPAQGAWNLRAAWRGFGHGPWLDDIELFVRLNNLFDQTVESQTGLPEPGRMVQAGVRLGLET